MVSTRSMSVAEADDTAAPLHRSSRVPRSHSHRSASPSTPRPSPFIFRVYDPQGSVVEHDSPKAHFSPPFSPSRQLQAELEEQIVREEQERKSSKGKSKNKGKQRATTHGLKDDSSKGVEEGEEAQPGTEPKPEPPRKPKLSSRLDALGRSVGSLVRRLFIIIFVIWFCHSRNLTRMADIFDLVDLVLRLLLLAVQVVSAAVFYWTLMKVLPPRWFVWMLVVSAVRLGCLVLLKGWLKAIELRRHRKWRDQTQAEVMRAAGDGVGNDVAVRRRDRSRSGTSPRRATTAATAGSTASASRTTTRPTPTATTAAVREEEGEEWSRSDSIDFLLFVLHMLSSAAFSLVLFMWARRLW